MAESIALGIVLRLKDEASRGVKSALAGIERLGEEADATQKKVAKLESGFRQLRDAGLALTGMGAAAAGALFSVIKPAATLHAFELDVAKAERAADVFFATSRLTATTVPQLTDAMREAGPAAAAVGLSLEETAAVLAGFAAKGVKGAKAGTAFRMILTRLAKPPADAARALQFLGVSVFDSTGQMRPMIDVLKDMQKGMAQLTGAQKAAVLKAIAGEEAFSKLGGLLEGNLDTLEGWQRTLTESSGALELAFGQKMEAASEQVKLLWISVKNLAISIGQPLLEALSGAAGWLAKVLQGITDFTKAHPILGKVIGVTLAVVGVFGVLAGSVLTLTGVLGLFTLKWLPLAKAGMGVLSGAVTRSAAVIKSLALATWSGVKAAAAWTAATVKDITVKAAHAASVVAGTVATWASTAASKAAAAAQWLWNAVMTANPIGLIIAGVAALIGGIVLLVKNWDVVTPPSSRSGRKPAGPRSASPGSTSPFSSSCAAT